MTTEDFKTKLQQYYGMAYPVGQRDIINEYLCSLPVDYIEPIFKKVILLHSSKWKSLPDVAIFEEAKQSIKDVVEDRRMRERQEMIKIEYNDEPILTREEIICSLVDRVLDPMKMAFILKQIGGSQDGER
jgi:hypothetical protein